MEFTNVRGMFGGIQMTLVGVFLLELTDDDPLFTGVSILLVAVGTVLTVYGLTR